MAASVPSLVCKGNYRARPQKLTALELSGYIPCVSRGLHADLDLIDQVENADFLASIAYNFATGAVTRCDTGHIMSITSGIVCS